MELLVDFPGGARVDANFNGYNVATDQPAKAGGSGEYPSPFEIFLASIGTCAGIYVLGFCRQRGLNSEGITIRQQVNSNPMTGMVDSIDLDIQVPADFPEKYYEALIRSADQCKVKKHLENPPVFHVRTVVNPNN
jgi:putative redox protein